VNATRTVREALAGTGIDVVGSFPIEVYDQRAPERLRSPALLPGARGVVVAGSAGPGLWRRFRHRVAVEPERWDAPNPYDTFVAESLELADAALARAEVRCVRFEAAFHAHIRVDFVALARLAGLGTPGPFALLIHPVHGPWWALRGAWLVDAEVDAPCAGPPPCDGCQAPCIGGWQNAGGPVARATPEVRARCVVGQASRYDDSQIAYHYDRQATAARLRACGESEQG
jgi:hypothetical protein